MTKLLQQNHIGSSVTQFENKLHAVYLFMNNTHGNNRYEPSEPVSNKATYLLFVSIDHADKFTAAHDRYVFQHALFTFCINIVMRLYFNE